MNKQFMEITGSTLKIIAIIAMLIDHIGAVIIWGLLKNQGIEEVLNGDTLEAISVFLSDNARLYELYNRMRMIGRIAFPLFVFLLIEGFLHTKNIKKYVLRLGIFAFISEIPFDLAVNNQIIELSHQNIFFTLFIGITMMWILKELEEQKTYNQMVKILLQILVLGIGLFIAQLIRVDYGAEGIIFIMAMYLFRGNRIFQIIISCLIFRTNITALFAFIPIAFYKGVKGWNIKYLFYLFYPVHLLVLYLVMKIII